MHMLFSDPGPRSVLGPGSAFRFGGGSLPPPKRNFDPDLRSYSGGIGTEYQIGTLIERSENQNQAEKLQFGTWIWVSVPFWGGF